MAIEAIPKVTLSDLTVATLAGTGVFDTLMRAAKAHLDQEYTNNRIKGADYATVYLGSLTQVMAQSVAFLLAKDKAQYDAQLIAAQVELAEANIRLTEAKIALEVANLPLLEAQTAKILREVEMMDLQESLLNAQINLTTAQKTSTDAQSALVIQKTITEKAQTQDGDVDENSVVGKQKNLYTAQTNGFLRDSEQKVAKLLTDSWVVRRTTDEGTLAGNQNLLKDETIGLAIQKMMAGVGVTVTPGPDA